MKKSTWVICIVPVDGYFYWELRLRENLTIGVECLDGKPLYNRRASAIRGAKRMAKRLRINAEVE